MLTASTFRPLAHAAGRSLWLGLYWKLQQALSIALIGIAGDEITILFQRRRFDYNELVGIAGNESHVLTVDSIFDLDTPEMLDELMELICAGKNLCIHS